MLVRGSCRCPLYCSQDGVQQVDHELGSGQEEAHQEDEDVGQDLLEVSPLPVREVLPDDVSWRRSIPDTPVLHTDRY